ncbi:hypothetical protein VTK56DRAFT_3298 [Thermocarpiscus australiensis]
MRLSPIFLAGAFALFANAQSSSGAAAATTTDAATAAQNSQQAQMIKCIEACTPGDVSCTSKCIAVPNPNQSQVNATNTCVAGCPKGNGTAAEVERYKDCVEACIGQNYFTTSGTPQPTGGAGGSSGGSGSGSGNGNGNGNGGNGGSASGAGSGGATATTGGEQATGTSTRTGAAQTSTGAAEILHVSGSAAGLIGFMAAVMAL